ncbi:MAG: isoleucine--tRNA ligase, partial [Oscillibacter sp.]|nr:isoleucine--tRNA ligase [Oscillibacter sp.]
MAKWEKIIAVRTVVNGALEAARAEKKIGKALEAAVSLTVTAEEAFLAEMDAELLSDLLIVSKATVTVGSELSAAVENAPGAKCPRCWKHSENAGIDDLCPRCAAVVAKLPQF